MRKSLTRFLKLSLKKQPNFSLKGNIIHEFFWSPFVDENKIKVNVKNGVATLTGSVNSLMEYDAATENAYEGGAKQVNNELKIKH